MLKKYTVLSLLLLFLCGCTSVYRMQIAAPDKLQKKDEENALKMSQIFGNKQETTLILSPEELEFALQHREYFAESVKMLGFSAVAVPFDSPASADIENERGKEIYDFVIYLHINSLKTFYFLKESFFMNRRQGSRFLWGRGNPYKDTLLNLKSFWRELPESAEMPTVIIALEVNRWNDRNTDRPSGLLFTWRKEKNKKGASNDRMFIQSMQFFEQCRELLDLEQLILLADEELVSAGADGGLTGGTVPELLKKCDALCINFAPQKNDSDIMQRLQLLKSASDRGSVFVLVSPRKESFDRFAVNLKNWYSGAWKYNGCAGIWIENWNKLNKIWREAK